MALRSREVIVPRASRSERAEGLAAHYSATAGRLIAEVSARGFARVAETWDGTVHGEPTPAVGRFTRSRAVRLRSVTPMDHEHLIQRRDVAVNRVESVLAERDAMEHRLWEKADFQRDAQLRFLYGTWHLRVVVMDQALGFEDRN
jgi:hypothetical protein